MALRISATVDAKAIERADKRLARYQGKPLQKRAERAYVEAVRLGVGPIRSLTPVGRTGNLQRSVAAAKVRLRPGEMAAATVGPRPGRRKGGHRHLVISGHRIVTHEGRDTGERVAGNPFVDAALPRWQDEALDFVRTRTLDIRGLQTTGYTPF